MPRMLDVSDDVRAEIGDEEADRLLAGENAPGSYDCTSCRTPGDSEQERTSTVLFIGDETAVLAFAHVAERRERHAEEHHQPREADHGRGHQGPDGAQGPRGRHGPVLPGV
ncbi:hypothetical protein ABZS63_39555, partial [Streptomyces sp. NPDC005568]